MENQDQNSNGTTDNANGITATPVDELNPTELALDTDIHWLVEQFDTTPAADVLEPNSETVVQDVAADELVIQQAISGVTVNVLESIADETTLMVNGIDPGDGSGVQYTLYYQTGSNEDGTPVWTPAEASQANLDMLNQAIIPALQAQGYTACNNVYLQIIVTPFDPNAQPQELDLGGEEEAEAEADAPVDPFGGFNDGQVFAEAMKRFAKIGDRLGVVENRTELALTVCEKLNQALMNVATNIDRRFQDLFNGAGTLQLLNNRLKAIAAVPWIYDKETITTRTSISQTQQDENSIRLTIKAIANNQVDGQVAYSDGNGGWKDLAAESGGWEISNYLISKAMQAGMPVGVCWANIAPLPEPVPVVPANDTPAPTSLTQSDLDEAPDPSLLVAANDATPAAEVETPTVAPTSDDAAPAASTEAASAPAVETPIDTPAPVEANVPTPATDTLVDTPAAVPAPVDAAPVADTTPIEPAPTAEVAPAPADAPAPVVDAAPAAQPVAPVVDAAPVDTTTLAVDTQTAPIAPAPAPVVDAVPATDTQTAPVPLVDINVSSVPVAPVAAEVVAPAVDTPPAAQ